MDAVAAIVFSFAGIFFLIAMIFWLVDPNRKN